MVRPKTFSFMNNRKETIKLLKANSETKRFPVLEQLFERSLKKQHFWEDRGFDYEIPDTSETGNERSNALIDSPAPITE